MASIMTSNFFKKLFSWRKPQEQRILEQRESISTSIGEFEEFILKVQRVLIWENPFVSSLYVVGINVLFWIIVNYEWRLYGLIFTSLLSVFIYELWSDRKIGLTNRSDRQIEEEYSNELSNEHFPRVLTVPEVSHYVNKAQQIGRTVCVRVRHLREEQPGTFCVVTCLTFLVLTVIGRSISGIMLTYLLIMCIMVVPGVVIHFVPKQLWTQLSKTFASQKDSDSEVEDLLPEPTGETLEFLKLASDLRLPVAERDEDEESNDALLEQISSRTNDTAESSASKLSFCPELQAMPSHENSLDCFDVEFDLAPQLATVNLKKSDSEESIPVEASDINFKSGHFNGDSSEEEEANFAKGLKFTEGESAVNSPRVEPTLTTAIASAVSRNIMTMGATLLSSVISKPVQPDTTSSNLANVSLSDFDYSQTDSKLETKKEKDSDSDSFELISEDEVES